MNKELLKKLGLLAGIIVLFLVLAYGFVPQVLQGKIVDQSDISGYVGMSNEMAQWNKAHPDDPAYWTESMFGGMPTTSISKMDQGDWTQKIYDLLLLGKRPATYLFIALLGGFLLLMAFGVKWYIAVIGAIAMAFCSYNFQIIQVGHNTKMQAIAFFPWVLAGLVYTYRSAFIGLPSAPAASNTPSSPAVSNTPSSPAVSNTPSFPGLSRESSWLPRTLVGAVLFALALSFQVKANHQQITYYLALVVVFYAIVLLVDVLWKHRDRIKRFFIASALLLGIGCIGIATNTSKLLPLYKYQAHTMRGGSELSGEGGVKGGLDLEYATAWSYGWQEIPNMMIPNFNGGASAGAVNPSRSETINVLKKYGQGGNMRQIAKARPRYWGPQPFTAGPMYMGAITVFLFVLGLFLYRGKEKWWLAVATVFAVLLALGNHFMAFTRLCFKVLPLYNKFRTVSMALITLQYTLPLLGFLVLDKVLKGECKKDFFKDSLCAFIITGGFCLLCWLIPGMFGSFSAASDAGQQQILVDAFVADRRMLFRNDALVSFLLILAVWGALLVAQQPKWERFKPWLTGLVGLLVLGNMFIVGKRYLNADHFTTAKNFTAQFAERPVDKIILADEDPSYRVLDLTVNVFNDSHPSYHHKNVGGYSPAKLQRYQDLIDHYLSREINRVFGAMRGKVTIDEIEEALPETPWLNALNTRYFIVGGENPPVVNADAFGPAWFVSEAVAAASPDEEILLAGEVDLRTKAVLGEAGIELGRDDNTVISSEGEAGVEKSITLTAYTPNELTYSYDTPEEALAVFSEVYYPGWKAWLDGDRSKSVDVLRADWTLRAAILPAGQHTLSMRFEPSSYKTGANVSRAASILLILLLLGSAAGAWLSSRPLPSTKTTGDRFPGRARE